MKTYRLPPSWSPTKFASRYGLNRDRDFYVNGGGDLVVFPVLVDDPPIIELPDVVIPKRPIDEELSEIKGRLIALEVRAVPPVNPARGERL